MELSHGMQQRILYLCTHSTLTPLQRRKLQQQAKQLDEQEAMIKTLNKQLTHCETDLQAHMDMVATLEASLGDSEKNRKCFSRRLLLIPCCAPHGNLRMSVSTVD